MSEDKKTQNDLETTVSNKPEVPTKNQEDRAAYYGIRAGICCFASCCWILAIVIAVLSTRAVVKPKYRAFCDDKSQSSGPSQTDLCAAKYDMLDCCLLSSTNPKFCDFNEPFVLL